MLSILDGYDYACARFERALPRLAREIDRSFFGRGDLTGVIRVSRQPVAGQPHVIDCQIIEAMTEPQLDALFDAAMAVLFKPAVAPSPKPKALARVKPRRPVPRSTSATLPIDAGVAYVGREVSVALGLAVTQADVGYVWLWDPRLSDIVAISSAECASGLKSECLIEREMTLVELRALAAAFGTGLTRRQKTRRAA